MGWLDFSLCTGLALRVSEIKSALCGSLATPGHAAFVLSRTDKEQGTWPFFCTPRSKLRTSSKMKWTRVGLRCARWRPHVSAHSRCPIRSVESLHGKWIRIGKLPSVGFGFSFSSTFTLWLLSNLYLIHSFSLFGKVSLKPRRYSKA